MLAAAGSMEAVQAAVEEACVQFQHPATHQRAEATLLQLRQSPRPQAVCQHILAHSTMLDARFHAACTLREAVIREWALMNAEELASLQTYLLQYALHHCTEPGMQVVTAILLATLAVTLKRSWGDLAPEQRAAFFQARGEPEMDFCAAPNVSNAAA